MRHPEDGPEPKSLKSVKMIHCYSLLFIRVPNGCASKAAEDVRAGGELGGGRLIRHRRRLGGRVLGGAGFGGLGRV